MATIDDVLRWSPFVARVAERQPQVLEEAFWTGSPPFLQDGALAALKKTEDSAVFARELRLLRQREAARIAIRDYLGLDAVPETLAQLTALAETLLALAVDWCFEALAARHGLPHGADSGEVVRPVVLGMGKLGGGELNFSSDIDLIAVYAEGGETDGGRPLDNQQFFIRLVQKLTPLLSEQTADGFVYRVDWRLRPFGSSGPLAVSFAAMEDYYAAHGRAWERYALVKARPVAGDMTAGARLLESLRPFIYRRYLDYTAVESLRALKAQIDAEVQRRGMVDNIKLGPGGIREVEFWVQTFQLIHGGRRPALQTPSLYRALSALEETGLVSAETVAQQRADYDVLRRVENHLQMEADAQIHTLPEAPEARTRLAESLGFADYDGLLAALTPVRQRVQENFSALFPEDAQCPTLWQQLWQAPESVPDARLRQAGVADPAAVRGAVRALQESFAVRQLDEPGRRRLDEVAPLLLAAVAAVEDCDRTAGLTRALDFLGAVARRGVYLMLLQGTPVVREELAKLLCASGWLARMLTQHPVLLEMLLDVDSFYGTVSEADYRAGAEAVRVQWGADEEAFMERLRQWKQQQVFQVAAQDVMGVLPLPRVSDRLTWIAEAVLETAWRWVTDWMTARHGALPSGCGLIAGYGKLGGHELGYGSDLDVVFLYHGVDSGAFTDGPRPLDAQTWMIRAAQKLLFVLTTRMTSGRLYEVDTRLRPNGRDGLLASSLASFDDYLRHRAWLWELQALVRASCVVGEEAGCTAFEQVREAVLRQPRDPAVVAREVAAMRAKMQAHLDRSDEDAFDLKQGRGGLVDIEFLVQYFVLAYAHEHPELTRWRDNLRLLEAIARAGLLDEKTAQKLAEAYVALRAQAHRLALADRPARVPREVVAAQVATVRAAWDRVMAS